MYSLGEAYNTEESIPDDERNSYVWDDTKCVFTSGESKIEIKNKNKQRRNTYEAEQQKYQERQRIAKEEEEEKKRRAALTPEQRKNEDDAKEARARSAAEYAEWQGKYQ
jgi:hypothetical protein